MFFLTDSELFLLYKDPQKQDGPWNFWSSLKIPGAHCELQLCTALEILNPRFTQ